MQRAKTIQKSKNEPKEALKRAKTSPKTTPNQQKEDLKRAKTT